jgi:hypothetical protein
MRQYMAYKHSLRVEMDGCDQTVLVPTDVEYMELAAFNWNHVRAGERSLQLGESAKTPAPQQLEPRTERRRCIRMLLREFPQRFPRDYVHQSQTISL